jgi:hypothetical protein
MVMFSAPYLKTLLLCAALRAAFCSGGDLLAALGAKSLFHPFFLLSVSRGSVVRSPYSHSITSFRKMCGLLAQFRRFLRICFENINSLIIFSPAGKKQLTRPHLI